MCRVEDSDYSTSVYRVSTPRARKPHVCDECHRIIQPGEQYHYSFQVYDGDAMEGHTCAHCGQGQRWLGRECGGWVWGEVWDEIEEHLRDYPFLAGSMLPLLVQRAQHCWKDELTGELLPIPPVPPETVQEYVT